MVTSEREMVKKDEATAFPMAERFSSLQAQYEDSVTPEDEWEIEGE